MTHPTTEKLQIDWLKTIGGALAAVSSAFLLSTLGAAGTIIGAALGSVIVTVSGALYSQALARSHQRLARAQVAALRKVGVAQAEVRRAGRHQGDDEAVDAHLAHAEERLDRAKDDLGALADEPDGPGWRERLALLPWKRILLVAAGLFVAAIVAITAFELVAGRSVSQITGGSEGGGGPTISRVGIGDDAGDDSTRPDDAPVEDPAAPTGAPSDDSPDQPGATEEPSVEPAPEPEPTTPAPTPTAPPTSEPVLPSEPAETAPAG